MTSARHQEGRTRRSRRNRSYAIAAVLAVVALVAGGVYALWSGKISGIFALAPKSAQDTLTEALSTDPAAVVKTVFDQIGASPSDGELAAAGSLRREQGVEVDLNGDDLRTGLQQPQGERSQPRTDLDNSVLSTHLCQGDYPAHRVGVVDEILSSSLRRSQTDLISNASDRRRIEQAGLTHQAPP